jgi:hypothetical protein
MTPVVIVEFFESYRELEGYKFTAKETYSKTGATYKLEEGIALVDGELLFSVKIILYGNTKLPKQH